MWVVGLAIALMVTMTPKSAVAQSQQGLEHGRGHDKNKWNRNTANADYQRGMREGQDDRSNRRNHQYRWNNNNGGDRSAYQAGYDAGYRNANGGQYNGNGQYGNGQYGNGQYGNGQYNGNNNGQYGGNVAAQMGAQDGMNDGRQDRQTGHSNRPTQGDNYRNALRGYNSSFGGENQYKAMYRQAYVPSYQRGYNNQGYTRR
jgi:hypothetical protein